MLLLVKTTKRQMGEPTANEHVPNSAIKHSHTSQADDLKKWILQQQEQLLVQNC